VLPSRVAASADAIPPESSAMVSDEIRRMGVRK
jgi:hypothetical protein